MRLEKIVFFNEIFKQFLMKRLLMSQKGWRVKKLFLSCQNSESTIFFFSSFPFFLINHNFNDMLLFFIRNSSKIIFCDSNIFF